MRAVEVPVIRFHDLRHTCATLLLQAEVHPKVVQEMLGHSSIAITLDIYSHVVPSMQDEAAQRLGVMVLWLQRLPHLAVFRIRCRPTFRSRRFDNRSK